MTSCSKHLVAWEVQTRETRVHCEVVDLFLKLQVTGGWIMIRSCTEGLQPFIPVILGFGFLFRRLVFGFLIAVWMQVLQDCLLVFCILVHVLHAGA